VYEISESVGSVIGNYSVGWLRDTTHSWDLDLIMFATMGGIAVLLTLVLVFMDHMRWAGAGAGAEGTSSLGALNQSSFVMREELKKLSHVKNKFFRKLSRRKQREEKREEESANEEAGTWKQSSPP
jgi:hypothetical protein